MKQKKQIVKENKHNRIEFTISSNKDKVRFIRDPAKPTWDDVPPRVVKKRNGEIDLKAL